MQSTVTSDVDDNQGGNPNGRGVMKMRLGQQLLDDVRNNFGFLVYLIVLAASITMNVRMCSF